MPIDANRQKDFRAGNTVKPPIPKAAMSVTELERKYNSLLSVCLSACSNGVIEHLRYSYGDSGMLHRQPESICQFELFL